MNRKLCGILGSLMLVAAFGAVVAFTICIMGWVGALRFWLAVAGINVWIFTAIYLIAKAEPKVMQGPVENREKM